MASGCGQESPSPGGARSQGKGRKVNTVLRGLVLRFGCPLAGPEWPYTLTRHRHSGPLRPISPPPIRRGSPLLPVLPPVRFPMVRRRLRSPPYSRFPSYTFSTAASPPSRLLCLIPLTPRVAIPCPTPRARAAALGYIASPRAGSSWSTNRARTRGLSIVLGSPLASAGSSSSSGRRGPPCRRSRWPGCRRDESTPGELVRPDSTCRGRVSSTLTPSDS